MGVTPVADDIIECERYLILSKPGKGFPFREDVADSFMVVLTGAFLVGAIRLAVEDVRSFDFRIEHRALHADDIIELYTVICEDYWEHHLKEFGAEDLLDRIEGVYNMNIVLFFKIESELHFHGSPVEREDRA